MNKILFAMLLGAVSCLAQGDVTVKRISESGDSPRISADGRFVAFVAVEGGVFVSNLETGEIERADTNVLGEPGNFLSGFLASVLVRTAILSHSVRHQPIWCQTIEIIN